MTDLVKVQLEDGVRVVTINRPEKKNALTQDMYAVMADAVATALANQVNEPDDIEVAIEAARNIMGILGVVATIDGHIGAWGNVHLVALDDR